MAGTRVYPGRVTVIGVLFRAHGFRERPGNVLGTVVDLATGFTRHPGPENTRFPGKSRRPSDVPQVLQQGAR